MKLLSMLVYYVKEKIKDYRGIKVKQKLGLVLIAMLGIYFIQQSSFSIEATDTQTEKVKVAFYEYPPYYFFDGQGNPAGYYHDLMEVLLKELNIKYEYVYLPMNECLEKLNQKEFDLLFGVGRTEEREEQFVYSKYYIDHERTSVYTNKKLTYGDLKSLEGLNFGYIENTLSYEIFSKILLKDQIDVNKVVSEDGDEIKKSFIEGAVDFIVYSTYDQDLANYFKVYEFSSGPVYMVTYQGNEELMNAIDQCIAQSGDKLQNDLLNVYSHYFDEYKQKDGRYSMILMIITFCLSLFGIIKIGALARESVQRKKIVNDLENDKFLAYYQPIVDSSKEKIIGFEALLRFHDGEKVLSPYFFLDQIEKAKMMNQVSLWLLKQVIKDYSRIEKMKHLEVDSFYISINISYKELQDAKFIEDVKRIIQSSTLPSHRLCFEIVERYKLDEVDKIQTVISELKQLGIKVAIDDFGVEYSNFDILTQIDYDIIKLDKQFIDDIEKSVVSREMIKCMCNIVRHYHKNIVLEGVETNDQVNIIRNSYGELIYIQGYFYAKPMSIEEIETFKVKY